jgi:UDP-2,4-diacetamido-2,4,6-trideoxy-beta-L-altropyranose hydrolase
LYFHPLIAYAYEPMESIILNLRNVTSADCRRIWEWTNDPAMLRFAFQTTKPVSWENHCRWFADTLSAAKRTQYLAETPTGEPAGQIRFEPEGNHSVVSVYLDADFRGKGLAPQLIRSGTLRFCAEKPSQTIIAWIKPENESSRRAFLAAGYGPASMQRFLGQPAWCLAWKASGTAPAGIG